MTKLTRIALHGAPRSGTSWLGEVLNSAPQLAYRYQPLFSYAFKDALTPDSTAGEIDTFFDEIAASQDDFLLQTAQRESGHMPQFSKTTSTHVAYKEVRYHHLPAVILRRNPDVKFVFILRDPRAVIASWLGAGREFRHDLGWDVVREWRAAPSKNQGRPEEFYGFEKWKDSATIFLDLAARHPQRVRLVWYSDLLASPEESTEELFRFCDLPVGDQTRDFVTGKISGARDSDYSVFRAPRRRDDTWRAHLPKTIRESIETELADTTLSRFLEM